MCESANLSRPSLLTYDFERDNKVYELQEQLHDLNVDVSKMTIQLQANV